MATEKEREAVNSREKRPGDHHKDKEGKKRRRPLPESKKKKKKKKRAKDSEEKNSGKKKLLKDNTSELSKDEDNEDLSQLRNYLAESRKKKQNPFDI